MLKRIGEYEFSPDESLGSGTFATVYRGRHSRSGRTVAIKAVDLRRVSQTPHEDRYLESEIQIMLSLRHPNIVLLEDVIRSDTMMYMVLEYCGGGDFASYIRTRKRLDEAQIQYFMRHLALGLQCLHSRSIAHRDLKPHNLLLSDRSVSPVLKIADFGFARMMDSAQLATTVCGSPLYMSPEVLSCQRYTDKADLWSVGAILYEALTGSPPFRARSPVELNDLIHRVTAVKLPVDIAVSAELSRLVTALLTVNVDQRISWDAFLRNSWIGISPETPKPEQPHKKPPSPQLPRDIVSPVLTAMPPHTGVGSGSGTAGIIALASSGSDSPASEFEVVLPSQQQQPSTTTAAVATPATTQQQRMQMMSPEPSLTPPGFASPLPPAERLAEELRAWGRMATAILTLGDLKVEAEYPVEGFALFVHGLTVVRNALLTAQRRMVLDGITLTPPADPRLRDALDVLRARLTEYMDKAERMRTQLAPHATSVLPEKLVYDHAMLLSREGALAEKTGSQDKARKLYDDALSLLSSIVPTIPLDRDKELISKYTELLKKRIAAVSTAASGSATSLTRS